MCYSCGKNLTKEEKVNYMNREFCKSCIKIIYETQPKLMTIYLTEDVLEECFSEFA